MPTMIIALMMTVSFNTTQVTVTEVNTRTQEVVVMDESGNEFAFYGDGYEEKEVIEVHFKNNHIIGVVE